MEEADLRSVLGLCGRIRRPLLHHGSLSPLHAAVFVVNVISESCTRWKANLSAISFLKKHRSVTPLQTGLQGKRTVAGQMLTEGKRRQQFRKRRRGVGVMATRK